MTKQKDNIIIKLVECDTDENKRILENLIKHLPEILKYSKVRAEICRSDYLAYVNQGFTEEQALELCRSKF